MDLKIKCDHKCIYIYIYTYIYIIQSLLQCLTEERKSGLKGHAGKINNRTLTEVKFLTQTEKCSHIFLS